MTKEQLLDAIVIAAGVTPYMTMYVAYALAEELLFRRVDCMQSVRNDHVSILLGSHGVSSDSHIVQLGRTVSVAHELSETVTSEDMIEAIRRVQEAEWKRAGEANCASCD